MRYCHGFITILIASTMALSHAVADESLKDVACRSVHLNYTAPESVAFYNEVMVRKSAPGTYFVVCGWGKGYFGLQELANGKKLVLFSVWDPGEQNDPSQVADDQRVRLLHKDDAVRVGRFGNEGTGGQSFFDYDWKPDVAYRCLVTAKADGQRTEYAGYFFVPEEDRWKHLVTFSTPTGGELLKGPYSFVEDFRRNRVSTTKNRRAEFGPAWVKTSAGDWNPLTKAQFTADQNPAMNIDAGIAGARMFLSTGGDLENTTTPLWKSIEMSAKDLGSRPADLPAE